MSSVTTVASIAPLGFCPTAPPSVAPSPYPGMGAWLSHGGCTFRAWAPFADEVFVAGDFTQPPFDTGKMIPLRRDDAAGPGRDYWSAHVMNVVDGDQYRFVVRRGSTEEHWKLDPYGRDADDFVKGQPGARSTVLNSVVRDPTFNWGPTGFDMPPWNQIVLYELHVGTFNDEPGGPVGSFADLIDGLDHLRDLGINAIEVMPAVDYYTETSMGYNPALLFAIETAYGNQHTVQQFVRIAHDKGLAVIFDVVYNHFGPEGLDDCLRRFDHWYENNGDGIYFYNDDRARTDFGTRPDFGRQAVRQFIRDNAMMWLHEYRADGLRLDSTVNIRRTDRGDNPQGWELMRWINHDRNLDQPWKITIAEDLQNDPWITKTLGAGGAGFSAQWDVSFHHAIKDALVAPADEQRDLWRVRDAIYRRYNGDAFQRIIYTESHDEVTVQHGNDLGRMPRKINWNDAEGWHAKKRSTLGAAILFTAPGIPMIFQGQEFLEWWTWTDRTPLDWAKAQRFSGILNLYRDLIRIRRNGHNNTRGLRGQHVNVFHVNDGGKVIAYHRWENGGAGDDVVVVANFSANAYPSYNVGFPRPGTWYLRFNSDWNAYDGSFWNVGYDTTADPFPNQGLPCSGNVGIGPYSAIVLSQ